GMIEHFQRPSEKGPRKRPAAEAFEAAIVDKNRRHFRARRANPAQTEPQVERSSLEPADNRIVGEDREQQHYESRADQREPGRARPPWQLHGGLGSQFVRPGKSADSRPDHNPSGT